VHSNRLLKKPVEEHSSGARSSTIKAEGEFIQVGLQVVGANRPLMGAHQPPFCESGDPVHSGEPLVRLFAGVLDGGAWVGVIGPSGTWVGYQSVGMDRGTGLSMDTPLEKSVRREFGELFDFGRYANAALVRLGGQQASEGEGGNGMLGLDHG